MRKILGFFILTLLTTSTAFAQGISEVDHTQVVMEETGTGTGVGGNSIYSIQLGGSGFFTGRFGRDKPYGNNSDYHTTICANEDNQAISIDFQEFDLAKGDSLCVWDELRTERVTAQNTPQMLDVNNPFQDDGVDFIGKFSGMASPGVITSTRGCLTFRFRSDDSGVGAGWVGKVGSVKRPVIDFCESFNSKVDSELECGVMIKDDNFRGENDFEAYGECSMPGWPANGRELIYKFVNHKASDLTFTLKEDNGDQPKVLNMFILNDCKTDSCAGSIMRPAAHGDRDRETVSISNAPAGTYYVVIDGNQPSAHNWFKLLVECTGGDYTTCDDAYYYDDFEAADTSVNRPRPDVDYQVGDYLTKVNSYWTKSDNVGIRDVKISSRKSSNGFNALEFNRAEEGAQDVFLDLGRKYQGAYRICWNMYIEKHHTAFFGLFGGDNSDPWGTVSKEFGHNNGYEGYVLYLDNRKKVYSGDYHLNLDALNFYALPKAHFYVDHLCYGPVDKIPVVEMDIVLAEKDDKLEASGSIKANDVSSQSSIGQLNAADLKVVPNPTNGFATVALDLAKAANVALQVFSPTGQIVRQISLRETKTVRQEINLGDLASGLYILKATSNESVLTKKIILQ